MNVKKVNIKDIKIGDTIICNDGKIRTVCKKDIIIGFNGKSVFGYAYKCGTELVQKVVY